LSAQQPKILGIIGPSSVGLPLAMAEGDADGTVIGINNFAAKVEKINGGSSTVEDVSDTQLQTALSRGIYKATSDFSTIAQASVAKISVPTTLDDKREPGN
jgi:UDP-N-acetyl-D-glucosamine dehydrogenase